MISPNAVNIASIFLIFIEGLLSFFSPCVLPLLPVYMGYLTGNIETGEPHAQRNIFIMTLCFIVGIFLAIFLLNTGVTIFSSFFKEHITFLIRVGGILIILLGIHQIGFIKFNTLEKTKKMNVKKHHKSSFVFAFLLGFTFSFSWTPCIGPALSSVLILANSSQSFLLSNFLMFVYALGLTIPFLLLGLFTNKALLWFSKHHNIVKYTVKIGAIILILMGIMMISGKMNAITNYMSPPPKVTTSEKPKATPPKQDDSKQGNAQTDSESPPLDYKLQDQHGNVVNFKDLRGKVVFMNFWATWCPPCKKELPDIQKLYEKYKDSPDVAVITIVMPGGRERDHDGIIDFLNENHYTMPVLFDNGQMTYDLQIDSYPTTFMLDRKGRIFGYVRGELPPDYMEQIIAKTLKGEK